MIPKHSFCCGSTRTSISLEEPFWTELQRIAKAQGQPVGAYVVAFREKVGPEANLASELRVMILADLKEQVSNKSRIIAGLRQQQAAE